MCTRMFATYLRICITPNRCMPFQSESQTGTIFSRVSAAKMLVGFWMQLTSMGQNL